MQSASEEEEEGEGGGDREGEEEEEERKGGGEYEDGKRVDAIAYDQRGVPLSLLSLLLYCYILVSAVCREADLRCSTRTAIQMRRLCLANFVICSGHFTSRSNPQSPASPIPA